MSHVRLRFKKEGLVRFISHLDWTRAVLRAMRRADVPFVWTQGFSPRPKVSFGPPLSLGWESETELMEIEVAEMVDLMNLSQRINQNLPQGMQLVEAIFVGRGDQVGRQFVGDGHARPLRDIKYIAYSVDFPRDHFVLKVEAARRMKDILNEISESLGESSVFVKRLAFYDKDWNRI